MRLWLVLGFLAACEGPAGPPGTNGTDGSGGANGSAGDTGPQGEPGTTPPAPWVVADRVDIAVGALTFDSTGAHVAFTLKDKDGKPLDRTGTLTTGKVSVSFVLAQLGVNGDGSPAQYTAYTTRTANAVPPYPSASATQATTEGVEASFETVDVTQGSYRYTFAASTAAHDATRTQSVLAVAARTVDGVQSFDRDLLHTGTLRREEINDSTCGGCHGSFAAHGGRYTKPDQCILCHTAQSADPESGNTVDFRVMIHKLHRGEDLPSTKADPTKPYQIVGFGPTVHDFSTIAFPGPTTTLATNISRCETCHAGAQPNAWYQRPSKAACTSCHDTTVFTAVQNPPFTVSHQGGVDPTLVNDNTCVVCHGATAGPAPVPAAHYTGIWDPTIGTMNVTIVSVTNTAPGQLATIRFKVIVNGQPRDILTSPLSTLTATIAGPTTDFTEYWQARVQGSGSVGTLAAVDAANGIFDYTFPTTTNLASPPCTESSLKRDCNIPPTASGSYQAAFEANWTPPTTGAQRIVANPPRLAFAVTGTKLDRRAIVDAGKCNGCHFDLSFHGGGRKDPNYCVMCHNPNNANDERISRVEGSTVFAESVDFRVMIHKIHMGEELSQAYILGGNPAPTVTNPVGAPENFAEVRYPRDRTACAACHTSAAWQLPMMASPKYAPSTTVELSCNEPLANDTDSYCTAPFWTITKTTKIAPESAVCTSCHDAPWTAAHALLNTTVGGVEACTTCHGPGKEFDVARYHGTP
jgi:OmcA/MtrC family decaheme c-type cytochrome